MPPVTPSRILRGCGLMGRIMGAPFEGIKRGTVSRYSAPAWVDPPAQSSLAEMDALWDAAKRAERAAPREEAAE